MITTDRVYQVIRDHRMIEKGDRVVTGVSGGADSMCLLFLMCELRERMDFYPEALHVHHGIRGKSADEDEEYVRKECEKLGIGFRSVRVDVPAFASKEGLSEEEAGRILRYRIFYEGEPDKIAIAHHCEDSVETLLFNLFRGTGLKGLGGIRMVSGKIIRPLLPFTREEIEVYCREKGILYRTDETNADLSYARNRIRNSIIPEAERINSAALKHMLEAAERIDEAREYIESRAEGYFQKAADLSGMPEKLVLRTEPLNGIPKILKDAVIKRCITTLVGKEKDISAVHVHDTEMLTGAMSGRMLSLPYSITVRNSFGDLYFLKDNNISTGNDETLYPDGFLEIVFPVREDGIETEIKLPDGSRVTGMLMEKPEIIPVLAYTKWLDYDKIKNGAVWRTRRPGDRISIQGGSKKVKDLFIEEKIPEEDRNRLFFLADGNEAVWIPGLRIGHGYKVTEETKRVLKVLLEGVNT